MLIVAPLNANRRLPLERNGSEDMLAIVRKPRSDLPAITHVDYSARIQTIQRADHPLYYDLIKAFEKRTGFGVIVNTSFNVNGEPIVCTPYDAYRCFMRTEMDVLVLGNYLLFKESQPQWPENEVPVKKNKLEKNFSENNFLTELRAIYTSTFSPVAHTLRSNGYRPMVGKFRQRSTMWQDCTEEQSPDNIFSIPKELDPCSDPKEMARAITKFWSPGKTTESLRPILESILTAAARFRSDDHLEEEVPESIYVMF
jgi:carbamoyltransferase